MTRYRGKGGVARPPGLKVALVLALSLALGTAGAAHAEAAPASTQASGTEERPPTSLLVKFRDGVDRAAVSEALSEVGARSKERVPDLSVFQVDVAPRLVDQAVERLAASPLVEYAEPNAAVRLLNVEPNDPLWGEQWGAVRVNAPAAWATTTGSSRVTVAVLDTGVDASHPDLEGALVRGYNAVRGSGEPRDDHGHGTQVAGIVAARANNDQGIAGMCWGCRIMPVKVLDRWGFGDVGTVAEGVVWAADRGADVINLSLGGPTPSTTLAAAIAYAQERGAIVVAAAGNGGSRARTYPAAHDTVVGVAASNRNDRRFSWSNYGPWVSVAAPGCATTIERGDAYDELCGTSAAAPLVAGTAALMRSASSGVSATRVQRVLEGTGRPLGWVRGGRVDAAAAVAGALRSDGIYALAGDWNGDGITTPGWFDNGRVYLRNSNSGGLADLTYSYGRAGDIPIVGDWNGDGRDTLGVIRGRWWYLRHTNSSGPAHTSFIYGRLNAGDYPLAGDWTGDGRDTVGVVRRGEWHLRHVNRAGRADEVFVYGRVRRGDLPLVGDWTGDGRDTPGIVRGGEWHLRHVNRAGRADVVFRYGRASDTPAVGDWNGDGRTTPGVVRGGTWLLRDRPSGGAADHSFPF